MNILFISTHLYPCDVGGVEIFNHYLIRALGREHRVLVLTACAADFKSERIRVLRINPRRLLFHKPSLLVEHCRHLLGRREEIDLIHLPYTSRSWLPGCYLPFFRISLGLPYVLVLHGGAMLPWKPRLPHRLLFDRAEALIAVSEALRNEYGRRSGREIEVIPPLIPFRTSPAPGLELRRAHELKDNDKIIVALGSIKKIKGSEVLLEAFLSLGEEYIEGQRARLLFAGDGAQRPELEKEAARRAGGRAVRFLGRVPHEEVPGLLKMADIYVLPSLVEGTPLSLLEAMFNGLPIVGSRIPGLGQFIRDSENGILFESGNPSALAQALRVLLSDGELRRRLGAASRATYDREFSFEKVVEGHLRVYEEVVQKRRNF